MARFKFIICGDLHYRNLNPRSRLDCFQEAIDAKLREVFDLAVKTRAKAIIIPGDITDGPGIGIATLTDLAMLLQEAPCPILTIPGNHDEFGANMASLDRTPYGLLRRLRLITDVSSGHCYGLGDIAITGHGYDFNTDIDHGQFSFNKTGDYIKHIHLVHSMLLDKPPGFDMRHTLIDQVQTNADIIVCGHEHIGFGVITRDDGKIFINPGALCRLSAHVAEMERTVQVAVITIDGDRVDVELVPIRCAQPGCEVLSREHIEEANAKDERMERFLALLASEGESKFMEVKDIVSDIAERENLPVVVKDEALRRIAAAREQLN